MAALQPIAHTSTADSVTTTAHLRRLKHYYQSAGWPVRDAIELDLLSASLIELRCAPSGHESIYVTPAGITALAARLNRNRRKLDAHNQLADRVAAFLGEQGRLSFLKTSFRVKPADTWRIVCPDVFSIRRGLDERYIVPQVHEIKVTRADLLGDLRNVEKRGGYSLVSAQLYYVFPQKVAKPEEIPDECGVIVVDTEGRLTERRPAPLRDNPLRPMHWLQLVARLAGHSIDESWQLSL
jgi:hypothetical protein